MLVKVNNLMQTGYEYERTMPTGIKGMLDFDTRDEWIKAVKSCQFNLESAGKPHLSAVDQNGDVVGEWRIDSSRPEICSGWLYVKFVHFDDTPNFKPDLTPIEMLSRGIFGGKYFSDVVSTDEYPESWWAKAKVVGIGNPRDTSLNYYGVDASQDLSDWRANGWINEQDPRGWFEWYCRFYMGRRSADDDRQIGRWSQFTRHIGQIRANCEFANKECGLRQKQALLHWAYDMDQHKYYKM